MVRQTKVKDGFKSETVQLSDYLDFFDEYDQCMDAWETIPANFIDGVPQKYPNRERVTPPPSPSSPPIPTTRTHARVHAQTRTHTATTHLHTHTATFPVCTRTTGVRSSPVCADLSGKQHVSGCGDDVCVCVYIYIYEEVPDAPCCSQSCAAATKFL